MRACLAPARRLIVDTFFQGRVHFFDRKQQSRLASHHSAGRHRDRHRRSRDVVRKVGDPDEIVLAESKIKALQLAANRSQ